MVRSRFVLLILTALIALPGSADGLQLEIEHVTGYPIHETREIIPYVLPEEGEHRVAVVTESHLTGLLWSAQFGGYDLAFFVQRNTFQPGMILADADGDGVDDVLLWDDNATAIEVRSSRTGAMIKSIPGLERDAVLASAELDGAPGNEWLLLDDDVAAYKGETLLWRAPFKAFDAATPVGGNVRGEVFVATQGEVVVLDAQSGAERRRLPLSCSSLVVGQTDSDAGLEIACTASPLMLADATTGAVQWTSPTMGKVAMVDGDSDGRYDVFLRRGGNAVQDVILLNGETGTPLTPLRELAWYGAVAAIEAGCESLLLAIEGSQMSVADTLLVFDPATLDLLTRYRFDASGVAGFAIADLDRDGRNEMIAHHDGRVTTATLAPHALTAGVSAGGACCGSRGMAVAQLDSDPALEYIIGSGDGSAGRLLAFDGVTHNQMWTVPTDHAEVPYGIETANLDGDSDVDVLTWVTPISSGAKGRFIYAFDGPTGEPLWRSVNIPDLNGMAVADMNGDGAPEVLGLSSTIGIVRLDGSTGAVSSMDEFTEGSAFTVANIDADPTLEIVAVANNRLFLLDGAQRVVDVALDLGGMDVTEMKVADIDGDGSRELLLARRESDSVRLQVRALNTLAVLWTSEAFPRLLDFAQHEFIQVVDADNDGAMEVTFFASLSLRVFRVVGTAADTVAPRFGPGAVMYATPISRDLCCTAVRLFWTAAESDASPPLRYEVFRAALGSTQPRVFLGTTERNEFVDVYAGFAMGYRYFVRVSDAAGNTSVAGVIGDVPVRSKPVHCRRRTVRR